VPQYPGSKKIRKEKKGETKRQHFLFELAWGSAGKLSGRKADVKKKGRKKHWVQKQRGHEHRSRKKVGKGGKKQLHGKQGEKNAEG